MILGEALQQGRHFFDEVLIITRPGAGQGGFQGTEVAESRWASEGLDQASVSNQHVVQRWILRHWARRRRSSGCRSMNSLMAARNGLWPF